MLSPQDFVHVLFKFGSRLVWKIALVSLKRYLSVLCLTTKYLNPHSKFLCYAWKRFVSSLFLFVPSSYSLFRGIYIEETILIQWPPLTPFREWHPASVNFLAIFFKKYLVVSWRPRSLFCSRVNCLIFFVKFTLCFLFVFWSRTWVNELTLRH